MIFSSLILELVANVAVFALATVMFARVLRIKDILPPATFPLVLGGLLGITAVVCMLLPIRLAEGVFFDARSIAVAGLFGGPVTAVVAVLPPLVYRLLLAGEGMIPGVISLSLAAILGLAFHLRCRRVCRDVAVWDVALVGILLPLTLFVAFLFFPTMAMTQTVMAKMAVPILVAYPSGMMLLGLLFLDETKRLKTVKELHSKQALIDAMHRHSPAMLFKLETGGDSPLVGFVSPGAAQYFDIRAGETVRDPSTVLDKFDPASRSRLLQAVREAETTGVLPPASYRVRARDGSMHWLSISANAREEGGRRIWNGIALEVTEQKAAELRVSELAQIVRDVRRPIAQLDPSMMITYFNRAAEELYGYEARDVIGRPMAIFRPPECVDRMADFLERTLQQETYGAIDTLALHRSGRRIAVHLDLTPLKDEDGRLSGWACIVRDRTEELRVAKELEKLATIDPLTGLANRRAFEDSARAEIERARRYEHELSLILLDVDHFKHVNDTHGHAAGDRLLEHLARTVTSLTRQDLDLVARIGGEEIVLLLPETSLAGAEALAERVRESIAASPLVFEGRRVPATASFGVSTWHSSEITIEAALRRADEAMYGSKRSGRDRVTVQSRPPSLIRLAGRATEQAKPSGR